MGQLFPPLSLSVLLNILLDAANHTAGHCTTPEGLRGHSIGWMAKALLLPIYLVALLATGYLSDTAAPRFSG